MPAKQMTQPTMWLMPGMESKRRKKWKDQARNVWDVTWRAEWLRKGTEREGKGRERPWQR